MTAQFSKAGIGLCNFNSNPDQAVREYYGVVKIDHSFGSKNTLSSSYNMDQSSEYEPTQTGITADDVYMRRQVWTLQDTHLISSNVVNTFRFGINRINYAGSLDIATSAPIDPRLYVNADPNIVTKSPFPQIPALTLSGFGGANIGFPALGFNYVPRFIGYTMGFLSDDVNIHRGRHSFQVGGEVKKWHDNIENYMSTPRGAYTFGTLAQFLAGGPATAFYLVGQQLHGSHKRPDVRFEFRTWDALDVLWRLCRGYFQNQAELDVDLRTALGICVRACRAV